MKKGFTLIEIIVCITLLSILGVTSVIIVKNSTNNELETITKKVLEAANVYVETEKDENGNNYLEEVSKGAKGVQIPISLLVDKGYIKNDVTEKIYNLKGETKKDNESYYVMFLSDGTDYCDKNQIESFASWMKDEGEPVYLCKNYTPGAGGTPEGNNGEIFINELINDYGGESNIPVKDIITEDDYEYISHSTLEMLDHNFADIKFIKIKPKVEGMFKKSNNRYYYRGNIANNYLSIGGVLFRILSFKEDEIRIIVANVEELNGANNGFSVIGNITDKYINDTYTTNFNSRVYYLFGIINADIKRKIGNNNLFKKTSFCQYIVTPENDEHNSTYLYEKEATSKPCENIYDDYLGLIDLEEANYAGVAKNTRVYIFDKFPDQLNRTGIRLSKGDNADCGSPKNYMENNSFLTDGGSIMTSVINQFYEFNKRIYDDLTFSYTTVKNNKYGLYYIYTNVSDNTYNWTGSRADGCYVNGSIRVTDTIDTDYIRPVMAVDPNEIKSFSGKGTENNPYVLVPKSTS